MAHTVAAESRAGAASGNARPKHAAQFLGVSEATLWRWAKQRDDFPRPIKLGPRTTVWPLDQLVNWRDAQGNQGRA